MYKNALKSALFLFTMGLWFSAQNWQLSTVSLQAESRQLHADVKFDIPAGFQEVTNPEFPAAVLMVIKSQVPPFPSCNVLLQPGRIQVDQGKLAKLGEDVELSIRRAGMVSATISNSALTEINHNTAARFDLSVSSGGNGPRSRIASILVPYGENHLVLTVTSSEGGNWEQLVNTCTTALRISIPAGNDASPPRQAGLLGGKIPGILLLLLAIGILSWRFRRARS